MFHIMEVLSEISPWDWHHYNEYEDVRELIIVKGKSGC